MRHATPSFFKIIKSPTEDLRVPPEFVRENGNDLGANKTVFLKVPNGAVKWEVEYSIREPDGEVWFENGWKQFTEHFHVRYGYFLMFDYRCYSNFGVLIFDQSATEICYCPPSPSPVPASTNRGVANKKRCPKAAAVTNEAMDRASAFESDNPFCIVTMQRSYVSPGKSIVCLPSPFCRRYGGFARGKVEVVSSDDGRRSWSVLFTKRSLTSGWRRVVVDNDLKVGDACVFEFFPGNVIKLIIFR